MYPAFPDDPVFIRGFVVFFKCQEINWNLEPNFRVPRSILLYYLEYTVASRSFNRNLKFYPWHYVNIVGFQLLY